MASTRTIAPAGSSLLRILVFQLRVALVLALGLGCPARDRASGELAAGSRAVAPGDLRDWSFAADFGVYLLKNPLGSCRARAGSEVEVTSIFDYIHYLPSGERVGNETQAIIERQTGEK